IEKGYVLSCMTKIKSDLVVEVPPESSALRSIKGKEETSSRFGSFSDWDFHQTGFSLDPPVRKIRLQLPSPTLVDNQDDFSRLLTAIRQETGLSNITAPLSVLRELPTALRDSDWNLTVTLADIGDSREIIRIEPGESSRENYGIAVDIGTTTVVAHLVDLETGVTLDADATYNSQITFGEDVIKRIIRAEEDGVEPLSRAIRKDINNLIEKLCLEARLSIDDINAVICAGNTTMLAIFLGITPRNIRREPYIPPLSAPAPLPAVQAGLKIYEKGILYCVPGIAGWVGGDITAGLISSGIDRSPAISLLIDVGTNGEIVVGNQDWQLTCSCSAGPAFEGSGIACGCRAVAGAIDKMDIIEGNIISYRTIGDDLPIGICGSGLLDAVSSIFRAGILGRDGRFNRDLPDERLIEFNDQPAYVIAPASETAEGREIVITQGDIDNLIRAKAAIYAGIAILLKSVSLNRKDIERVLVSGGFGNYINIERAICIGLLPDVAKEKIFFIGNGSVRGAKTMLLSREALKQGQKIASSTTYFELSTELSFMDEYTRAMFLPHTDIEDFPSCGGKIGNGE
ncbi:MAG: ASKHA domain-containing protein, partial [Candidatus Auribacterota bacterium]|nr:ASKHA domain-containing protein [Candidatus Auribacterota bacterium]